MYVCIFLAALLGRLDLHQKSQFYWTSTLLGICLHPLVTKSTTLWILKLGRGHGRQAWSAELAGVRSILARCTVCVVLSRMLVCYHFVFFVGWVCLGHRCLSDELV